MPTGDFFGEIALTVVKHRTADVKSLGASSGHGPRNQGPAEPVELFQLLRTDFEAVMDKYPILKTRLAQIGQVFMWCLLCVGYVCARGVNIYIYICVCVCVCVSIYIYIYIYISIYI